MKNYPVEKIRNIALFSHGGAGKTSLAEAMLFSAGVVDRMGKTVEGSSHLDFDPDEVRRGISISSSLAPIEWKDHKINIIDTPGYLDFVGEVAAAMRVVDTAVVLVDAVTPVEVGTEIVWEYAEAADIPRLVIVNRMDRENADFSQAVELLKGKFGPRLAPIILPLGEQAAFAGVVDIVKGKAYAYADASGKKIEERAIPGEMQASVDNYREMLVEAAVEADDDLMMKYLEGEAISDDELIGAIRLGSSTAKMIPIICTSALKNIGAIQVLDTILSYFPSPAERPAEEGTIGDGEEVIELKADPNGPLAALVFKTMADPFVGKLTVFKVVSGTIKANSQLWNVQRNRAERIGNIMLLFGKTQIQVPELTAGDIGAVAKLQETTTNDTLAERDKQIVLSPVLFPEPSLTAAVEPKSKGDEEKIGSGLVRLAEEDPTFKVLKDPESNQTVITGMGDLHLDVILGRLQRKFGAEVKQVDVKLPYRETIRGKARVQGRHKKQSGGRGQYGDVWLELEPNEGYEFVDRIVGGVVPRQFIPAVEKGMVECLAKGVIAGYPVVNIKVSLVDGSYHDVDSSEMAFKIATSLAFKKGFAQARPVLLEPIMDVAVTIPDEYMGDIIGDLNKKRGRVMGMEAIGNGRQVVKAHVPQAELFKYATDLRSMTQGRGKFTMVFDHYEEVPAAISEAIISAYKAEEEEE
ncbi:MAG: elongation factor G [Symbiobacteriaceae bacterium]|nr:elongation factor G [Symbiobacteriaceae bacterium]